MTVRMLEAGILAFEKSKVTNKWSWWGQGCRMLGKWPHFIGE